MLKENDIKVLSTLRDKQSLVPSDDNDYSLFNLISKGYVAWVEYESHRQEAAQEVCLHSVSIEITPEGLEALAKTEKTL
jgi:hypothetical protein